MFDIGWTELLLIGIVALIVIGPEDLPDMFRQLGRFTAKLRSMSRDFQRAIEQAAKDSGVKDLAKDVNNLTSPSSLGLNAVKDAADRFEKWDPLKPAKPKQPLTPAPIPPSPSAATAAPAAVVDPLASTPEELADSEPEPVIGPETKALYEKKAKAAEARKAAKEAKSAEVASSAADTQKPKRKAPATKATAPASAPPAVEAAAKPKTTRRKKADPA